MRHYITRQLLYSIDRCRHLIVNCLQAFVDQSTGLYPTTGVDSRTSKVENIIDKKKLCGTYYSILLNAYELGGMETTVEKLKASAKQRRFIHFNKYII